MIWIKLIKKWGEYKVGDVALFADGKGGRLIKAGIAEKTKGPDKKEKPKEEVKQEPVIPKVETAVNIPKVETATAEQAKPVKYNFKRVSNKESGNE